MLMLMVVMADEMQILGMRRSSMQGTRRQE
jgi:hypothetical protein